MAPEVITEGRLYDSKADIWSLGITLLEMCYGEPPMSGQPAARAVMLIGDKKMRAPRLEGNGWSKDMKDFVIGCLNEEPGDRSPAEELAKMRWIKMQAKTGLGVLNELIVNYKVWKDKGGERQSLAPGVGAKTEDEEDDEEYQHGDWAFDVSSLSIHVNIADVIDGEVEDVNAGRSESAGRGPRYVADSSRHAIPTNSRPGTTNGPSGPPVPPSTFSRRRLSRSRPVPILRSPTTNHTTYLTRGVCRSVRPQPRDLI